MPSAFSCCQFSCFFNSPRSLKAGYNERECSIFAPNRLLTRLEKVMNVVLPLQWPAKMVSLGANTMWV